MATADDYAAWIVKNADKKGTPDFDIVAQAYQAAKATPQTSMLQDVKQGAGNALAGLVRGAGSIGATLLTPYDLAMGNTNSLGNPERRKAMDEGLRLLGAEPDAGVYQAGKMTSEILGTLGAGGLMANGLRAVPVLAKNAAPVLDAIASSGMRAGGLQGLQAAGARALGGGVAGATQAALSNPGDAGVGAAVGAVAPGVLQAAGKLGRGMAGLVNGPQAAKGNLLANAMGVPAADVPALASALAAAPRSLVPGADLTVNQALQLQGVNQPGVKMLERIVAGGPGGNVLLQRYADQSKARLAALADQGAAIYPGAAADEATRAGDKLGAILRTQAADDAQAARLAWQGGDGLGGVYGRAAQDGVQLQLPLAQMQAALRPLGPGSVLPGTDARRVLQVANDIGTEVLPGVTPLRAGPVLQSQNLEQAVRAAGGIRMGGAGLGGELRDLGIRQSGTTGLINNQSGRPADLLAEQMYNRGFIPDADPATLLDALRNGGGRRLFANDAVENNAAQRLAEAAMGDAPEAERIARAVPFAEFQRLRRDAGSLAAKASERAGNETEAGVLSNIQGLLTRRADEAASGATLAGDNLSPEFLAQYNQARALTRANAERYKGGNNITSILRRPAGQDYSLTGNEITNKLWHGGAGLAGDVDNLKNVLSGNNYNPALDTLRRFVMTDAAGKTTAASDLGSAFPRYVENRMPGLLSLMTDEQLGALTNVAKDMRNADAASAVKGLLGSDTQAKIARAMDAGLLDSPVAKMLGRIKGGEVLRNKGAEIIKNYKGQTVAQLLANPAEAAKALRDAGFVQSLDSNSVSLLKAASYPVLPAATQKLLAEKQ